MDDNVHTTSASLNHTNQKARRKPREPRRQQLVNAIPITEAEKIEMFWQLSHLIRALQKVNGLDKKLDPLYEHLDVLCAVSSNPKFRQGREALFADRCNNINAQMARRFIDASMTPIS